VQGPRALPLQGNKILRWCNQETPKFVMKSQGLEVISDLKKIYRWGCKGFGALQIEAIQNLGMVQSGATVFIYLFSRRCL